MIDDEYLHDMVERAERAEAELARVVAVVDKCRESAGLEASPDGPTGDVTNLLHRGDVAEKQLGYAQESVAGWSAAAAGHVETIDDLIQSQTRQWAMALLRRDDVQGRKVLERMVAYYEEHDGKADDFGRLYIVTDAMAALGREP